MKPLPFLYYCFFLGPFIICAQNQSSLTIDQIMQGEGFVGYLPTRISWTDDSQNINFSWNPDSDTIRSMYQVNIATKTISKLSSDELRALSNEGDYSDDYGWKVYQKDGDLFIKNLTDFNVTQITNTLARESNPMFSQDDTDIIYQLENNLYKWNIANGTTTQLTDFKKRERKENYQFRAR